MLGTGSPEAAAPRRSVWALLTGLGGRHRLKLALTYALTLAENGLNVLYPYLTGIAIDAVLSAAWAGVAPLLIAWTVQRISPPISSSGSGRKARTPPTWRPA